MGLCFHHRRRARALPSLVAVTVLTALFAGLSVQAAAAGAPPCPSCPFRMPPPGSSPGSGGQAVAPLPPLVSLGAISVQNGVASVTGTVNAAANVAAQVEVTVNGARAAIAADGSFAAAVGVAARAAIVVRAGDMRTGATFTITIPASAVPANGVAADALAQLDADRVTLLLPPDGFTIVDGLAVRASVRVAGITGIAKLTLNGANLLAKLEIGSSSGSAAGGRNSPSPGTGSVKPGSAPAPAHHTASAPVSGAAKKVELTVTAANGASQTSTVRVKRVRSVIRIGKQLSVSAFGARGIRISAVRFDTHAVRTGGTLGVLVTVRDRRSYLVRDAVVILQPSARRPTIVGSAVRMSSTLGRAAFRVRVGPGSIGHLFSVRVVAQTPRSSTHVTSSVSLCGCVA